MSSTSSSGEFETPAAAPPQRPAPLLRTAAVVLMSAGLGMLIVRWLESEQTKQYVAFLQAERIPVVADRRAILESYAVQVGATAGKGDVLGTLVDSERAELLQQRQAEVQRLTRERDRAEAAAEVDLAWRMDQLQAQEHAARMKLAGLLRTDFEHQLKRAAWTDFLESQSTEAKTIPPSEVFAQVVQSDFKPEETRLRAMIEQESASNAVEVTEAQVALCEQRLKMLESLREKLPAKVRRAAGVDSIARALKSAEEAVAELEAQPSEIPLPAPGFGTVGQLHHRPGTRVEAGTPLLELLDGARLRLTVEVPSRELPRFAPGELVRLIFPGDIDRLGRIAPIPPQAEQPTRSNRGNDSLPTGAAGDSHVLLQIDPADELWPDVPIGSAVQLFLDD